MGTLSLGGRDYSTNFLDPHTDFTITPDWKIFHIAASYTYYLYIFCMVTSVLHQHCHQFACLKAYLISQSFIWAWFTYFSCVNNEKNSATHNFDSPISLLYNNTSWKLCVVQRLNSSKIFVTTVYASLSSPWWCPGLVWPSLTVYTDTSGHQASWCQPLHNITCKNFSIQKTCHNFLSLPPLEIRSPGPSLHLVFWVLGTRSPEAKK